MTDVKVSEDSEDKGAKTADPTAPAAVNTATVNTAAVKADAGTVRTDGQAVGRTDDKLDGGTVDGIAGKTLGETVGRTVRDVAGQAARATVQTASKAAAQVAAKAAFVASGIGGSAAKAVDAVKTVASAATRRTRKAPKTIDHLAMVITTYKRQNLLATLFESILALEQAPWRIIVVDNEQSDETKRMVEDLSAKVTAQWGRTVPDRSGNQSRVVYAPQTANLGGAGGFSAGVKKAYQLGAEWFWVMDDDVAVLPDGIAKLAPWTETHEVIQGSRFDYDGGPFYWQYDFRIGLGIPNPIAPAAFGRAGYRTMNTLCFEGGLFNRRVVKAIGLPDPRFFIYWDDTIYGYRASKVTAPIVIPDVVLRRTREIGNWDIAGVRQLNSTSDMNRYHIMRNRGYMARYFMVYGDYRPVLFALGTAATAAKELIRLVMVDREHLKTGVVQLAKGWWDSRKLLHDRKWRPMPAPLPDVLDD